MIANDFSEEEILSHFKDGGKVCCSIRLASGNDFTITLESADDYEIVKNDIILNQEMVLFVPGAEN